MTTVIVTVASKGAPLSATDFDNNMENLRATADAAAGSVAGQDTAAAAPVAGAWTRGWIRWNTAPELGGNVGWICTTAGAPGTWASFGLISANPE